MQTVFQKFALIPDDDWELCFKASPPSLFLYQISNDAPVEQPAPSPKPAPKNPVPKPDIKDTELQCEFGKDCGKGQFGKVFKGMYHNKPVAVKQILERDDDFNKYQLEFKKEIAFCA